MPFAFMKPLENVVRISRYTGFLPFSKIFLLGWLGILCWQLSIGQSSASSGAPHQTEQQWVDSVLAQMTPEQRIGQLFMVATYSKGKASEAAYVKQLIQQHHIGGIIFMQGTPSEQVRLSNAFQEASELPLMMAQDAEWGLNMRLKETVGFPRNMTLGAIRNDSLLYTLGTQLATHLKRVGIHVNFAPVIDINNNPRNPVINTRSFGENKFNVARKGIMVSRGMQDHGVLPCMKHFPGHGDTDTDSHFDLPVIGHSRERLDTLELYPFVKGIEAGVGAMMIAHLYIPAIDPTPNRASTLSPVIVNGLVRKGLKYDGLIFTDALNMHGVTKYFPSGEVEVMAFKAGNDVLLYSVNVPKGIAALKKALEEGEISASDLEQKVRRILAAKYRVGLADYSPQPADSLDLVLRNPQTRTLRKRLYESALTLVKNENNLLPLKSLDKRKIAFVQVGGAAESVFSKEMKKYGPVKGYRLRKYFTPSDLKKLLATLKNYNTVILGAHDMNRSASKKYGVTEQMTTLGRSLREAGKEVVLAIFGSPYSLRYFGEEHAILMAYESAGDAQRATASAIFGGLKVDGRLPVTASERFPEGTGVKIDEVVRFGFALPEEEGMDGTVLARIDSLATHYISQGAFPGCAILVARGNNIVYEKGFGQTMRGSTGNAINPYLHTYDLASVTKVAATTLVAMKLVESNRLKLDEPIVTYLPELKGTEKAKITARKLLEHSSGLPAWHPFYQQTFSNKRSKILNKHFYSTVRKDSFTMPISDKLYAVPSIRDTVWKWIEGMELSRRKRVRYSDIGMLLLQRVIEAVIGTNIDRYSRFIFYRPMGMNSTYFQPALKGLEKRCPPTVNDNYWRMGRIQGYVHDETSAILGGRTGHAGLFSNIYDLAKLGMMLKNGGRYGGEEFLYRHTIETFTQKQRADNRKGLGWDRPETNTAKSNPVSEFASEKTFGHTGFTGTCIWIDPKADILYIFLSNRTYPRASNRLMLRNHVRIQVMDQIYTSIKRFTQKTES